jgi:hypothetical protein
MWVLVDTSVWVDYFRSGENSGATLDTLIDDNLVATNDIILAELLPFLLARQEHELAELLNSVKKLPLHIVWEDIIQMQLRCLQQGANGIGIPDLLIAQNTRQHDCEIYSLDKHFRLLESKLGLRVFSKT